MRKTKRNLEFATCKRKQFYICMYFADPFYVWKMKRNYFR